MERKLTDIIKSAEKLGYKIDKRPYKLNIIGVRSLSATNQEKFDDLLAYFTYDNNGNLIYSTLINNPQTFITTVGLYNNNNELLAVAKLSRPLVKDFTKEALIKVKLDY